MILTKELVMATDQCTKYHFKSPFYPGKSCEEIYNMNPESRDMSGYYWITDGPTRVYCGMTYTGSSCVDIYNNNVEIRDKSGYYRINDNHWTYCNMTEITGDGFIPTCAGVGGGWRRIAHVNISAGGDCPTGWVNGNHSGVSFCYGVDVANNCSSVIFSTNEISYQRVCGRARGYQKGFTFGFAGYHVSNQTIDGYYANALSITYSNPRQHLWTYAAGLYDNFEGVANCPCAVGGGRTAPPFVGTNYYCESGNTNRNDLSAYYLNDPLWDGSGCITSTCCDVPTQPWFYRELNETTTSDIEARICGSSSFRVGSLLIDQLQLYIQ